MTLGKRVLAQVLTRIHMMFASPHDSNNAYSYSGIKQNACGSHIPLTPRVAHEPRRLPEQELFSGSIKPRCRRAIYEA
jgi:hypothetical protein